ncbi:hypothetical protein B7486_09090 [cyanobacterium TDX16]|nr:hypothetical protein B7486_09090 [cyanobacterium TDX16]
MSRSWVRLFVCAVTLLTLAGSPARGQMAYRKVMRSGEPAPDTTGFFGTQQLSYPSIDEAGYVSFSCYLAHGIGGVDAFNQWTLYSENALGELHLVARQGDPTPGNVALHFEANSFTTQHKNPLGQVAFYGVGAGPMVYQGGCWAQNTLGAVVRVAFGNETFTSIPAGGQIESVGTPSMSSSGDVVFQGFLKVGVGGVTVNDDGALWCRTAGGPLRLVAREGDSLPNLPPGFMAGSVQYVQSGFSFNNTPLINAGGQVAFSIPTNYGIMLMAESHTMNPPRVAAYQGQLAPGLGNVSFLNFTSMTINNDGNLAFNATLTGMGVNADNDESIWVEDGGALHLIAREGDAAPGGGVYYILYPPALSANGEIAFSSFLKEGIDGVNFTNDFAVYKYTLPAGTIQLIMRDGMDVPGFPPGIYFDTPVVVPCINNVGQLAFYARIAGAPEYQFNGDSLWATTPSGVLTPVVVKGQSLEISPGVFRTVNSCGSFPAKGVAGQDGLGYPFNNSGQVCFSVNLSDGTNAIYVSSFAPCPDSDGDGTDDCADGCPSDATKTSPGVCGCGVADSDSDADGTVDCNDGCPADPLKVAPGICGCGVVDSASDMDGDGTPDCIDGCPNDILKIAPGACGCGVADTDSDADGTADCNDACPADPLKVTMGVCGCGVADTDSDGDGTPDCNDACPADPLKIAPGVCGCGVADSDSDGDGTLNCNDGCPADPLKTAPGICGCGVVDSAADTDGDGTLDCLDGCPNDAAKTAPGACGCGNPDTDTDGDGRADCVDNCPNVANPSQADADGDGIGDACDAMPAPPPGPGAPPPGPIVNPVSGCGASGGSCGAGMMTMLPLMMLAMRPTRRRRTRLKDQSRCRATRRSTCAGLVLAFFFSSLSSRVEAQCFGTWTQRTTATFPERRVYLAMSYDTARGVTVLFGGTGQGVNLADTWEWDGTAWSRKLPLSSPSARCCHAMVYDAARGVTVLFGGYGAAELGDTWEWDGVNWTQRMPAMSPIPREAPAMAYDSARGVTVLFGGYAVGRSDETWEWDGTNWSLRSPVMKPLARYYHAMTYDSARQVVVLFGGGTVMGNSNETWEWNGTNWTNATPMVSPTARLEHALCYDAARETTVLFGGSALGSNNETWEWTGGTWTQLVPMTSPAARSKHAMAYDALRRTTVLYGGDVVSTLTWEWEGPRPAIVSHPQARVVGPGQRAEFVTSAAAVATLSYRWRRNGVMLADGGSISGSGTGSLVINPAGASDAGMYDCVVGNACGATTSRAAALSIDACLTSDASLDCDTNGILDSCQIASNASLDANGNGSLDSCEGLLPTCGACGAGVPMMMPLMLLAVRQKRSSLKR